MRVVKLFIGALLMLFSIACKKHKKVNEIENTSIEDKLTLPYFNSPDFTPDWSLAKHKIPDFSFINQNNDTITNQDYKGNIYIANFFFTSCPGLCTELTTNMKTLQKTYNNDPEIKLLSHSVMPWFDTPEILKNYAITNGINDTKWNLVTGNKNELYDIARNGYFSDSDFIEEKDNEDFIHTENFILVDKNGYIRGVYNGTLAIDVQRLIRHIEILKN